MSVEKHQEVLTKLAEVLEGYDLTLAEKVGILAVTQHAYISTAGGSK